MNRKSVFIGLFVLGLMTFMASTFIQAATFNVDMGKMAPPCGGAGTGEIGFVDCSTTMTGGIVVIAMTTIHTGNTVRWIMTATPHTTTSETALNTGGLSPTTCGTGDIFDTGIAYSNVLQLEFTHTFNTPGTCTYFCIIHPTVMQGQVIVAAVATTTTTSTTTTTTTITTTSTTTTTTCNDQNKGNDKDKGKGHVKGRCKGHDKDK